MCLVFIVNFKNILFIGLLLALFASPASAMVTYEDGYLYDGNYSFEFKQYDEQYEVKNLEAGYGSFGVYDDVAFVKATFEVHEENESVVEPVFGAVTVGKKFSGDEAKIFYRPCGGDAWTQLSNIDYVAESHGYNHVYKKSLGSDLEDGWCKEVAFVMGGLSEGETILKSKEKKVAIYFGAGTTVVNVVSDATSITVDSWSWRCYLVKERGSCDEVSGFRGLESFGTPYTSNSVTADVGSWGAYAEGGFYFAGDRKAQVGTTTTTFFDRGVIAWTEATNTEFDNSSWTHFFPINASFVALNYSDLDTTYDNAECLTMDTTGKAWTFVAGASDYLAPDASTSYAIASRGALSYYNKDGADQDILLWDESTDADLKKLRVYDSYSWAGDDSGGGFVGTFSDFMAYRVKGVVNTSSDVPTWSGVVNDTYELLVGDKISTEVFNGDKQVSIWTSVPWVNDTSGDGSVGGNFTTGASVSDYVLVPVIAQLDGSHGDVYFWQGASSSECHYQHNGAEYEDTGSCGLYPVYVENDTEWTSVLWYANTSAIGASTLTNFNVSRVATASSDSTPPLTDLLLNGTAWTVQTIAYPTVNLSATFGESVSHASIRVNGGTNFTSASVDVLDYEIYLSDGSHYVEVWVNDTNGNANATNYSGLTIDTTAPTIVLGHLQNGSIVNKASFENMSIGGSVSDVHGGVSTVWTNDSQYEYASDFPVDNTTAVSQGGKSFLIYANDTSGNEGHVELHLDFDVETPVVSGCSVNDSVFSLSQDVNVSCDISDNVLLGSLLANGTVMTSNAWYSQNASDWGCSSSGVYRINITAYDWVSNMNNTEWVSFEVDNTLPEIVLDYPLNASYNNTGVFLNFSVSDSNLDSVWWSNDSGVTNRTFSIDYNISTVGWSEAQTDVYIWSNDSVGNLNETIWQFTLDDTVPVWDNLTEFRDKLEYPDESFNLTVQVTETNIDSVWLQNISNAEGSNISLTLTSGIWYYNTTAILSTGVYNYTLWMNDSAGNENHTNGNYTIHNHMNDPPTITFSTIPQNVIKDDNAILDFGASDADGDGISSISLVNITYNSVIVRDSASLSSDTGYTLNFEPGYAGTHYVYATATDGKGNSGTQMFSMSVGEPDVSSQGTASGSGSGGSSSISRSEGVVSGACSFTTPSYISLLGLEGVRGEHEFGVQNLGDSDLILSSWSFVGNNSEWFKIGKDSLALESDEVGTQTLIFEPLGEMEESLSLVVSGVCSGGTVERTIPVEVVFVKSKLSKEFVEASLEQAVRSVTDVIPDEPPVDASDGLERQEAVVIVGGLSFVALLSYAIYAFIL